jgi:hypothetical protein
MPTTRKPASKTKTTARTTKVKAPSLPEPGTVMHREPANYLEQRVTSLEQTIDLLLIRFAVTESSLEAALTRIKLLQASDTQEILGL